MTETKIPGLDEALRSDIYDHCFSTTDREVGGVLVGTVEGGKPPRITGSIRASLASETAAQITFTQDAWAHIHQVLDEQHPGAQIVGWYHTHPGYGLFLSQQDLFIQTNFFNNHSQIALVIDPIAEQEAVFAWWGGEVREYCRRPTAHRSPAALARDSRLTPPPRELEPSPWDTSSAERGRAGDARLNATPRGPRPPWETSTESNRPGEGFLLSTWIYVAVIGLCAGVVFWELILK